LKILLESGRQAVAKSPVTFWKTSNASTLNIDASFETNDESTDEEQTITIRLIPVSPADSVDYLAWSEGSKNAAAERAEKEKKYPRLNDVTVDATVKFDGRRRVVSLDLSDVKDYEGAMKRVDIIFPNIDGKATVYSVGFDK
jgi:hypothetical protein